MGFLAPAAPFVPMLVGAGVGAIADKDNPLRGAMLGAVGGSFLGPTMAGLTGAGSAASEAALASGLGAEGAQSAAQAAAAQGMAGLPVENAVISGLPNSISYNTILGDQLAGMGTEGMKHYLGSAGVEPLAQKAISFGTMGPQGIMGNMGIAGRAGMSPAKLAMNAGKMILGQPQQPTPAPAPATAGAAPARPPPPYQPVKPFITGMRRREDPMDRYWGYS